MRVETEPEFPQFRVVEYAIGWPLPKTFYHARRRMGVNEGPIDGNREQSRNNRLDSIDTDGHAAGNQRVEEFMNVCPRDFSNWEGPPPRKQILLDLADIVAPSLLAAFGEGLVQPRQVSEREHRRCR